MTTTYPYILRDNDISLFIDGIPYNIDKRDAKYARLVDAIRAPGVSDITIKTLLDETEMPKAFVAKSDVFKFAGNRITYRDRPVNGALAKRISRYVTEGLGSESLANFLDNLAQNPSKRVYDSLYEFLEYGKCAMTPDGHFMAYKRVCKQEPTIDKPLDPAMKAAGYNFNLVDTHSKTFSNNIGTKPTMIRNMVVEDASITCAEGLHVCSFDYLKSFSGEVIIAVKVNPADVVAIPKDYSNTKMRVTSYEVINVLAEPGSQKPSERVRKVLTEKTVICDKTVAPSATAKGIGDWGVGYKDEDGAEVIVERFNSRANARAAVSADVVRSGKYAGYKVFDLRTE